LCLDALKRLLRALLDHDPASAGEGRWLSSLIEVKGVAMLEAPSQADELLANIQAHWSDLATLLEEINSHWVYEDLIYRFYHQSFKVYALQRETKRIVAALQSIAPSGTTLSPLFEAIYHAGASGMPFEIEHNKEWAAHTRVFLEAFFHARFFLEMAVKYGKKLQAAPSLLPSGWAALLCLYNLR
jgi:hypothetical protein